MTSRFSDLKDCVVVVTGGSRGIGAATARRFAENGARVVVSGRDQTAIDDVVAAIKWDGGRAVGIPADVTSSDELASLRRQTESEFGPAAILIACAGGNGEPSPTADLSEDRWRAAIDSNLTATYLTVAAFLGGMIQRKHGVIITMASAAARQPAQSNIAYAAAKAGIIAFTRHLAKEAGPCGVRVNCIAPSAIVNDRMRAGMSAAEIEGLGQAFPLLRVGQPTDVADAALYLSSDSANWITGVVLDVAGGKIMV
jgi:3-oxoacyl-[acyl-carrier protein] reductase